MSSGGNIQGVAHFQDYKYLVTESQKCVFQKVKNGHKNPDNSHHYHDEKMMKYNSIKEIVKGAPYDTQHQDKAHPKKSYRLWWGIDNAELYNRKYIWNRTGVITVSYNPTHQHSHTNFWYASILERAFLIA